MKVKVLEVKEAAIITERGDDLHLFMKATIPETKVTGRIDSISYCRGSVKQIHIHWANPFNIPALKAGDTIKFTKE